MKVVKKLSMTVLSVGLLLNTVGRANDVLRPEAAPLAATPAETKAKPYPLDFCLVSDEKFAGSDMKPFEMVYEGQTIKFCCKSCVKDFKKEPKKFLAKMASEVKKQDAAKKK